MRDEHGVEPTVTTSTCATPSVVTVSSALAHHRDDVQRALDVVGRTHRGSPHHSDFTPGFELPAATPELLRLLQASELAFSGMGRYRGRRLTLLDLMRNLRTRTTKTFASLVMVARAVRHIQRTGESIMLLTPSSANKGTALRDAVLRAIEAGLVSADQLRIVIVVPVAARPKLWASPLDADAGLRARNPVVVYPGDDRSGVKRLACEVADRCAPGLREPGGMRLWSTLHLDNYRVGDAVRAFAEAECLPSPPSPGRLHVHAVSSAFGLLGHHFGRAVLAGGEPTATARYLLVQHLETPDMVLSLYSGSTSREHIPAYAYDRASGLFHQASSPHFPATTFDPAESLESTFYTHQPATSDEMSALIRSRGGGGIVVSLHECLTRYAEVRALLAEAEVALPADPRRLREWSLVMAMTGVLNAVDRDLVDEEDILVHGSGSYSEDDFEPIPAQHLHVARDVGDLRRVICDAALAAASPCRPGRGEAATSTPA
jgi:Family of unknown function (DUF6002)